LCLPTYYTPGERCDTAASSSSFLVRATSEAKVLAMPRSF
jgi:hypothetical protein